MKHLAFFLASGFYSGLSPKAPGTVGSAVGLGIWYILASCSVVIFPPAQFGLAMLVLALGLISVRLCLYYRPALPALKDKEDPQVIVIDEWAGVFIALYGVSSSNLPAIVAAFALFRFFDIMKPGPVGWAEKLPGEWGIMLDDVVAGIFAAAIMNFGMLRIIPN